MRKYRNMLNNYPLAGAHILARAGLDTADDAEGSGCHILADANDSFISQKQVMCCQMLLKIISKTVQCRKWTL